MTLESSINSTLIDSGNWLVMFHVWVFLGTDKRKGVGWVHVSLPTPLLCSVQKWT